jgi:hypothetical protein
MVDGVSIASIILSYQGPEQRLCIGMYIRQWPKQIDTKYQTAEMPRLHRSDMMNTVQRVVRMHATWHSP